MSPAPTNANPPLRAVYRALLRHFGPQHWWPGRTRFEVMVGAILTQNTAWTNVEQAIARLRQARALHPARLHALAPARLADLIRPAGYFNVKATRLRALTTMLHRDFGGSLDRLFRLPTPELRPLLLGVCGIGPETADSMLLYAGQRPVFVVDAYTRRLMERHGWLAPAATYDAVAATFARRVPATVPVYNEYHALLVALGKRYCRPTPRCPECPLRAWLPHRVKKGTADVRG
jgi:endonuclease-3 related protein